MRVVIDTNSASIGEVKIPQKLLKTKAYKQVIKSCASLQTLASSREFNKTFSRMTARPGLARKFNTRIQEVLAENVGRHYSLENAINKLKVIERDWQHKRAFRRFRATLKGLKVGQKITLKPWTGSPIVVARKRGCFHFALTRRITVIAPARGTLISDRLFDRLSIIRRPYSLVDALIDGVQADEKTVVKVLARHETNDPNPDYHHFFMHYLLTKRLLNLKQNETLTRKAENGLTFTIRRAGERLEVATSVNVTFKLTTVKEDTDGYDGVRQLATMIMQIDPTRSIDGFMGLSRCEVYAYGQKQVKVTPATELIKQCLIKNQSPAIHALLDASVDTSDVPTTC